MPSNNAECFRPIYVSSVLAGEKSGALTEVLDRYVTYQRLTLAVAEEADFVLIYPAVLMALVICLMIFLVTYVVPNFAALYNSMEAKLPLPTQILIAIGTTAARLCRCGLRSTGAGGRCTLFLVEDANVRRQRWICGRSGRRCSGKFGSSIRWRNFRECWARCWWAEFRWFQALGTAARSLGTVLLKNALDQAAVLVREGKPLSSSLAATGMFPAFGHRHDGSRRVDGRLAADVEQRCGVLRRGCSDAHDCDFSLIEPAIMIFMGIFVAFVLVALYLPIFSLADSIR